MMQLNCPCCNAHIPLEAALQDAAGRELVGVMAAMPTGLALGLVRYLSFFRPQKQQLGWGRSLRMAREVLALSDDATALLAGLVEATRTLDEKRGQPGWKPLGNHNYLRRCLESVLARGEALPVTAADAQTCQPPRTRGGAGLVALEGMKR